MSGTCATCKHFEPGEWTDKQRVIVEEHSQWVDAFNSAEVHTDTYAGTCNLADTTNPYTLWGEGGTLPISEATPGAPLRAGGDGCCAHLSVKADFGCNAWEAK
jgi:hypothetical protein